MPFLQPGRQRPQPKLRKQPQLKRVQAAAPAGTFPTTFRPHPVPETARKRRQRNQAPRLQLPTAALKRVLFSARWISLSLLAICGLSLYLIGTDANFYLTHIPVAGVASIPPAEIVAASGLGGAHIFSIDPTDAATAITRLPGVISATVTIEWPNQVKIDIQEDTPVAVWIQDGQQFWINRNGQLTTARQELPGLLQIESEVVSGEEANQSEDTPIAPVDFISQGVVDGALQLRQLRPNIERLYYRPAGGLSYRDGRGWQAYFGVGNDMDQKLVVYETLVNDLLQRGLIPVYISVSNKEKPYYLANGRPEPEENETEE